jgi:uncharacterized protein
MKELSVKTISQEEFKKLDIANWPIWTKEISHFDWIYEEESEDCYIIEGEVIITTERGEFHIKSGDFVSFEKGLKCNWKILEPIKKHYNFR